MILVFILSLPHTRDPGYFLKYPENNNNEKNDLVRVQVLIGPRWLKEGTLACRRLDLGSQEVMLRAFVLQGVSGALAVLMKDAIKPNLMQTLEVSRAAPAFQKLSSDILQCSLESTVTCSCLSSHLSHSCDQGTVGVGKT